MVPPLSKEVVAPKGKIERIRGSDATEKSLLVSPGHGRECVCLGEGADGEGAGYLITDIPYIPY